MKDYSPELRAVTGMGEVLCDSIVEGCGRQLTWSGVRCWKNPLDLIMYAEIVHDVKPNLVIETGTNEGGSALFWQDMLDLYVPEEGQVVTVDIEDQVERKDFRVEYHIGSSTDSAILQRMAYLAEYLDTTLVNLDSDHNYDHVCAELEMYAPLVTVGSYLIVEDGVDDFRWQRQGPYHAVQDFLQTHPEFKADPHRERFGLTNCPGSFLKRVSPA